MYLISTGGWVIIVLLGLTLIPTIVNGIYLSTRSFKCRTCDHIFKAQVYKLLFITHFNDDYIIKCPNCQKKRIVFVLKKEKRKNSIGEENEY